MRDLFVLIFSSFLAFTKAFSQDPSMGFSITEVVKLDSTDSITLAIKAKNWLKTVGFKEVDTAKGKFSGISDYFVYQRGIVSNQVHGKISYTIDIEVKDNKYRYTFNNFVFHYYKQDRYGSMVPTGKTKPLSDKEAPGWQKTWENHKSYSKKQINILAESLRVNLTSLKPAPVKQDEEF